MLTQLSRAIIKRQAIKKEEECKNSFSAHGMEFNTRRVRPDELEYKNTRRVRPDDELE